MERLIILFTGNFLVMLLYNWLLLFLTGCLFKQHLAVRKYAGHFWGLTLLAALLISALSWLELYQSAQLSALIYLLLSLIQILTSSWLLRCSFDFLSLGSTLLIQSIAKALTVIFQYLILSFAAAYLYKLPADLLLFSAAPLMLLQVLLSAGLTYTVRKTQFFTAVQHLFDYRRFPLSFGITFFTIDCLLYQFFFYNNENLQFNSLILAAAYLILLIIFSLWTYNIEKNRELAYNRQLLSQQQNYLQQLASVQQELRSVQHDYKNMLAGIYLHAAEGNLAEVQAFLTAKLFKIDHQLEEKIKQQNQLLQIENIEIRGLLLTKLALAQQLQVKLLLEIVEPLTEVPLNITDFLRILGIFLDNALEAAAQESPAEVQLILLQEPSRLILSVKNPVSQPLSIKQLQQTGFSTKGGNRGLGLTNVKNILVNYPQVLHETTIKNHIFSQTLIFEK